MHIFRNTHPLFLGAAVSLIVVSLVGTAAIVGFLPSARSARSDKVEASVPTTVQNTLPAAARQSSRDSVCTSCGTLAAVRKVEIRGDGTGIGAVAGGLTGAVVGNQLGRGNGNTAMTLLGAAGGAFAGNEIEKDVNQRVTYRVTVHMDDGSFRTISQPHPPAVAPGGRVRIIDGTVVARS